MPQLPPQPVPQAECIKKLKNDRVSLTRLFFIVLTYLIKCVIIPQIKYLQLCIRKAMKRNSSISDSKQKDAG